MHKIARRLAGRAKRQVLKLFSLDRFLKDCSGVIHVGANSGQERHLYAQHRLPVIWIEPLDAPFQSRRSTQTAAPAQTYCSDRFRPKPQTIPWHPRGLCCSQGHAGAPTASDLSFNVPIVPR
jgi:hypothetical protein